MTKFLLKSNSLWIVQFYIWFISFCHGHFLSLGSIKPSWNEEKIQKESALLQYFIITLIFTLRR